MLILPFFFVFTLYPSLHPSTRVYTVSRRHPQGWFQWGYMVLLFPFRLAYVTVFDLCRFVLRLFQPDPRRIVTDPVGDVVGFIRRFEEVYGSEHPTFYQGTYSQVSARNVQIVSD